MSELKTTADFALSSTLVKKAVEEALAEDLGLAGDVTSRVCIPAGTKAQLVIRARQTGVLAGLILALESFKTVDANLLLTPLRQDGDQLHAQDHVLKVRGEARSILAAERVALNFMGRLSGIASLTAAYIRAVEGTEASIVCTRKTTPGLRAFEKYAVRCGGGKNHRFGLFDAVLIKDNHIAIAGGVLAALRAAKRQVGHMMRIEIEVDTLEQLEEVLTEGADCVMLDNMPPERLQAAIARIRQARPDMRTEASGGVKLENVAALAATGVDLISVGALTHSAPVFDFGLDFVAE